MLPAPSQPALAVAKAVPTTRPASTATRNAVSEPVAAAVNWRCRTSGACQRCVTSATTAGPRIES